MHSFLDGLNLKKLFFIGLVEHFEDDVENLFCSLQLKVEKIPVVNKNSLIKQSDLVISDSEIEEIKKLNQKDLLLYQQAAKIKYSDL